MKDNVSGQRCKGIGVVSKYEVPKNMPEERFIELIEKKIVTPYEQVEGHNVWLNTMWDMIFKIVCGTSTQTFTRASTRIGVGSDSTAASATQTDLLAATNKLYVPILSGYPYIGSGYVVYMARFNTSEANFAWNEAVVKNTVSGVCWNRVVQSFGTKTSMEIWYITITLSYS